MQCAMYTHELSRPEAIDIYSLQKANILPLEIFTVSDEW